VQILQRLARNGGNRIPASPWPDLREQSRTPLDWNPCYQKEMKDIVENTETLPFGFDPKIAA
jgi:hypothetical protein